MAELPESWKLKTRKRQDGKLDVIGKDDLGSDYKVCTCESGSVTESDVKAIAECDREQTDARTFVKNAMDTSRAFQANQERQLEEGFLEDAARLVRTCTTDGVAIGPDQIDVPLTMGSTTAYRNGYDRWAATWRK